MVKDWLKESEPVISMEMYEAGAWNLEPAFGSESSFHISTYHKAASGQGGEGRWIDKAVSSQAFSVCCLRLHSILCARDGESYF